MRSYPHRHHHGGYYYRWHLGYAHHGPYPWYRSYGPYYGLNFGYAVTYYPSTYASYFVDATPYYLPGDVVSETYVDDVQPEVVYEQPVVEPQPQVVEPAPAPAEGETWPAAQPHADYKPALDAFFAGEYGRARELFRNVVNAEPGNGEAWLGLVHANFALGFYKEAADALAQAAALDAFPRGYQFDPRPLYRGEGGFDRPLAKLDGVIAKRPDNVNALLVRAYLHVALGERVDAQAAIQRVLEMRPEDETAPRLAMALLPPPPPPAEPPAQPNGR